MDLDRITHPLRLASRGPLAWIYQRMCYECDFIYQR